MGVDDYLVGQTGGWAFALFVAVLLGLRHATDPDHLTALLTLRLSRSQKNPHLIGLGWGIGHAITVILVGAPLILFVAELPERLQQGLEFAVGAMIVLMAATALARVARTSPHAHRHGHHDGVSHDHPHAHGGGEHSHRTPRSAFMMGLLHGSGGSAGVVALILSSLDDKVMAVIALVVIAVFSGVAMIACSWLMCRGIDRIDRVLDTRVTIVVAAVASMIFGAWYCLAALADTWYPL